VGLLVSCCAKTTALRAASQCYFKAYMKDSSFIEIISMIGLLHVIQFGGSSEMMRLFLLLLLLAVLPAQAQSTRCYLPGREDRVSCLQLAVPLDWSAPKATKISIFAAVIPALSRSDGSDPVFLLPGGPGQSGDSLLDMVPTAFRIINQSRDLVLIYPRGTHRSTLLACAPSKAMALNDTDALAQLSICAKAQKIDPRFFTSQDIARDMEAVRKALGYARINIWGGSFGTRLAQHYALLYPATTRSLILDGATPITQSILLSSPASMERALDSISQACSLDASCRQQRPKLKADIAALVAQLTAKPQAITLIDPATLASQRITLDGKALVMAIRLSLYAPQTRSMLPPLIRAALSGNYQPFAAFASAAGLDDQMMSTGAHLSAMCAEDVAHISAAQMQAASKATVIGTVEYENYIRQCALWPHRALKPMAAWKTSAVPTLILSGALDPVTPPALGTATAALFKGSRHIIIPASGHISSGFACAPNLLADFLDTLTPAALDTKCLMHAQPPAPLSSANG
jgi:pimeloyl-ACP methyl ester carboxylesterase